MVKFCSNCKKILPIFEKNCPFCKNENLFRYCKECKRIIRPGENACPLCGDKDPTLSTPSREAKPKNVLKKKSKVPIVITSVIIVLAIAISSTIFFDIPIFNSILDLYKQESVSSVEKDSKQNSEDKSEIDLQTKEDTKPNKRRNCNFRNTKWGDSLKNVKKYETDVNFLQDEANGVVGETSVGGYKAYVTYLFENDMLYRGAYFIDVGSTTGGAYIIAHDALKDDLIEKYGQPKESAIVPLTSESLIEIAGDADALQLGYVMYASRWETTSTDIVLGMKRENRALILSIIYTDINYEDTSDNGL